MPAFSPEIIQNLSTRLKDQLSPSAVFTDSDTREIYSRDKTADFSTMPDIVVKAVSTEDVSKTLRICNERKIPVTPRGAGTGVTGGALAVSGGVLLSLEKMNKIIEIDPLNMTATVEPGVITGNLQQAAEREGLMYPPDPASLAECTIGGNAAETSGGPRAVKYGTTKDYVLGLEYVLADGSILFSGGKFVKNATGYNLTGLLIGSEGTLAVITKLILRLIPAPLAAIDILIPFDSIETAADAVRTITQARIIPAAIEFMEEEAIMLVAKHSGNEIPFAHARAHLLIQLDGKSVDDVKSSAQALLDAIHVEQKNVLLADNALLRKKIWSARRSIRTSIEKESPVFFAEDSAVPRSEIPSFIKDVKTKLKSFGVHSIFFGHAGDGNVHINVLCGSTPYAEWKTMVPRLKREIYTISLRHGGNISGEHGIGYIRKEYLPMALSSDELSLSQRIKDAFDQNHILNPGKILL